MAEVYIGEDESKEQVARELLDQAEHPDHVVWTPRSNTAHGGVFTVPDDKAEELIARRVRAREADDQALQERLGRAAERDELASRTGLTPAELGFSASVPESRDDSAGPVFSDEDDEDGAKVDAEIAAEDEAAAERAKDGGPAKAAAESEDAPAQDQRAAARKAARRASAQKKDADADSGDGSTDKE